MAVTVTVTMTVTVTVAVTVANVTTFRAPLHAHRYTVMVMVAE
jgi:hypothetical protein